MDWLSLLVKAKAAAALEPTLTAVVDSFKPFLSVAAAKQGTTESSVLSTAVFKLLVGIKEDICDSDLKAVECVEFEDVDESGHLEKLTDDVLCHALSFLGTSDRVFRVELSCRRLFHLSRKTSICEHKLSSVYEFFGRLWKEPETFDETESDSSEYSQWRRRHFASVGHFDYDVADRFYHYDFDDELLKLTTRLQSTAKSVTFKHSFDHFLYSDQSIFDFEYPSVSEVSFDLRWTSKIFVDFLMTHPSVRKLSAELPRENRDKVCDTLLRTISACKGISDLTLECDFAELCFADGCDFAHIRRLSLKECKVRFGNPLFHSSLECLTLDGIHFETDASAAGLSSMASLRKLCITHWEIQALNSMCLSKAPMLETITLKTDTSDMETFLGDCETEHASVVFKDFIFFDAAHLHRSELRWSNGFIAAQRRNKLKRIDISVPRLPHFECYPGTDLGLCSTVCFLKWLAANCASLSIQVSVDISLELLADLKKPHFGMSAVLHKLKAISVQWPKEDVEFSDESEEESYETEEERYETEESYDTEEENYETDEEWIATCGV